MLQGTTHDADQPNLTTASPIQQLSDGEGLLVWEGVMLTAGPAGARLSPPITGMAIAT